MKSVFFHINRSLSLKLSLGILLFVVMVFVLSLGFLFQRSRQLVKQEAMEHATRMLENTALRVTGYLDEVEKATDNMEWLAIKNLQPDSLYNYTRRVVELNPNVNGCSITMEPAFFPQFGTPFSVYSLRGYDTIETVIEGKYNYYEKVWYKTPRERNEACWVDPFNDFNEGTLSSPVMIASYCKPLKNPQGDFIGVISTDLSIEWLSRAITAEKLYPHSYCMMLGTDGRYFVHPDRLKLVKESIFSSVDAHKHHDIIVLGHEMTSGKTGNMRVNVDGKPCIVFYQPLKGTTWSIALVCPESEIFAGYNRLGYILIPLLVIGLVLMLIVCWKIVQHFIRPLDQLAQQSRHIAAGHYHKPLPSSNRVDVVGHLQNSFVQMQQSINANISDMQRVNDEAERRNSELLTANALIEDAGRRKAAFIHDVSLQIRTPLNIIAGFMQVLRETFTLLPKEEVVNFVETMKQNADTIKRMSTMIFDVSRMDGGQKLDLSKEVEVIPAVQKVIKSFEEKAPHDVVLNLTTTLPDHFTIHTNRLYLNRVLSELLINAKKFASGKEVGMTLTLMDSTTLRFVIEDKGVGITEAERDHVFIPFVKLDSFSEGLGLGLGLSQQYAHLLGGTLVLDSTYTEGARFIFDIPCA